jgi:nitrite reductase (NO-forming)
MEKALTEIPDYVVFNGSVGALSGSNAVTASVGETVRLFVGNGGPNLVSSFHVIGEIFDAVHVEGGSTINNNVQTTLVPAGGSAIVDFSVETTGTYIMVDHSIFRAFNKGAIGMLKVDGTENTAIYSGKQEEGIYLPEGSDIQIVPGEGAAEAGDLSEAEFLAMGERVYSQNCAACHQPNGTGIPGAFPPLAGSDYLAADKMRAIGVVINGLQGEVTVNGTVYNSVMPGVMINDQQVAAVLTYVMNSWRNNFGEVSTLEVAQWRSGH